MNRITKHIKIAVNAYSPQEIFHPGSPAGPHQTASRDRMDLQKILPQGAVPRRLNPPQSTAFARSIPGNGSCCPEICMQKYDAPMPARPIAPPENPGFLRNPAMQPHRERLEGGVVTEATEAWLPGSCSSNGNRKSALPAIRAMTPGNPGFLTRRAPTDLFGDNIFRQTARKPGKRANLVPDPKKEYFL